jgi:HTH-type transcriptional regulator/antitoxin HigA
MRVYNNIVAIPPGETIKEELEFLKMSQKDFSERMGMAEKTISQIINGEASLSYETAIKLESVLGIPASLWNSLESGYREKLLRIKEEEEKEKEWSIAREIPYKEILKRGWIKIIDDKNKNEIIKVLKVFFSVASLEFLRNTQSKTFNYYNELEPTINFKKGKEKISEYSMITWIRKGELEATKIETGIFNKTDIKNIIPEMKKLSMINSKDNIDKLKELCRINGIALVITPHLAKTYVDGVSKWIDKDTALIILSNRRKGIDSFWFNFFHELGHLLKHNKKKLFINAEETLNSDIEKEANEFANNTLIPKDEYRNLKKEFLNEKKIKEIAEKLNIHPSIIVGRLQFDKIIKYNEFSDLKENIFI